MVNLFGHFANLPLVAAFAGKAASRLDILAVAVAAAVCNSKPPVIYGH